MRKFIILLVLLLTSFTVFSQEKFTVSGRVFEEGSGESLIGVHIYIPGTTIGTVSNSYGFYSITLKSDTAVKLKYSYVGFQDKEKVFEPGKDAEYDVFLPQTIELDEVVISADKPELISQVPTMSTVEIPVEQIKAIPALLGEKDVFKALQLLPGVQKGQEGSSGFYVRGGGPDQNLIILDDATVYNANHLFGFFSLFNGDALKSVELIKGGFPARYGGRLSSVVEMNMKDGNREKFGGEAGIGLISSRATFEGPIIKNKSSFLISGRRTYIDILTRPLFNSEDGVFGYYFYDLNAKVNYEFDKNNRVYLSGYFGRDKFHFSESGDNAFSAGMFWQNATSTARWNHVFNNKLFSNMSAIFSIYRMKIFEEDNFDDATFSLEYKSGIRDFSFKYDFQYLPSPDHTIRFGLHFIHHRFKPSAVVIEDTGNDEYTYDVNAINAIENGLYIEDEWKFGRWKGNTGFRLSHYICNNQNYIRPEPRLMFAYMLNEKSSLKASWAMMNQYVHLLSNTGLGLPTDLWVPATDNVKPQRSWQVAAGYARDLTMPGFSLSIEGYYKQSDDVIGYKEGASFLLIADPTGADQMSWETNVTGGNSESYGAEILLQKKLGKWTGWAAYTLSWTWLQFEEVNSGERFYAKYDRRHEISLVSIYNFTKELSINAVWVFASGNAISLPQETYYASIDYDDSGPYNVNNTNYVTYYGPKNAFRMSPYHRLDLGLQFHKELKNGSRTWELSIYNMYNRKNPFFYYIDYVYENGQEKSVLKQVALFPMIPSISFTRKF
ncbi:MAG: TonB-dependent receptor [Marinilabiliales bacterium]|nr:MAG: TonB-dependent receptor [Marinilabiliales bacterium]